MSTTTFGALRVGDRIFWRGADGNAAEVWDVEPGDSVDIRWTTAGVPRETVLAWNQDATVDLVHNEGEGT